MMCVCVLFLFGNTDLNPDLEIRALHFRQGVLVQLMRPGESNRGAREVKMVVGEGEFL